MSKLAISNVELSNEKKITWDRGSGHAMIGKKKKRLHSNMKKLNELIYIIQYKWMFTLAVSNN